MDDLTLAVLFVAVASGSGWALSELADWLERQWPWRVKE